MVQERRTQSTLSLEGHQVAEKNHREAGYLFALMTAKRPVSRRNRASWYLRRINKILICDDPHKIITEEEGNGQEAYKSVVDGQRDPKERLSPISKTTQSMHEDIKLISITPSILTDNHVYQSSSNIDGPHQANESPEHDSSKFLVTPNTRVLYISRSIATSIILDLSPSIVSVSSRNGCIFSDIIFDSLKMVLNLLVKAHELPSSTDTRPPVLETKVFISVIAYTPFMTAKCNQVLVQNRRISNTNIDQVLVELWISLDRLFYEIQDLISNSGGVNLYLGSAQPSNSTTFLFPPHSPGNIIRHPGQVLDDILELGVFSTSLLPRLSRRSVIVISDGLFSFTNNLSTYRLKNIALSFISLNDETTYPDSCFGYAPSVDLMKFMAISTLGVHLTYRNLSDTYINLPKCKPLNFLRNPVHRLFCWTLHSDVKTNDSPTNSPRGTSSRNSESAIDPIGVSTEQIARFFCADRPVEHYQFTSDDGVINSNVHGHHDWKLFRQMKKNLDADFEHVLSCLLREGYLIKTIQFRHKEVSKIVARLVLHWRHNLDLERELTAPYWSDFEQFESKDSKSPTVDLPTNVPIYGSTYSEVLVHGSYGFLLNLFSDRRSKRRSEFRDRAYRQFKQLIDGVLHTHDRLQYLSRYYKDQNLSQLPSYLLHGNSLLYEQPHTRKLTSTVENVADETRTNAFQEYWQRLSNLDTRTWKNLMHIHTLRLVLEHDQPKFKNIHCQNANGRFTHVQCRRAMSAISNFIKEYSSFALLEDSTYIKFVSHQTGHLPDIDDLRELENSATKGFIVIRINKLLPIIVIYLMFTSGIPDSHRTQIVSYIEDRLITCKLKDGHRNPSTTSLTENIIRMKTIVPSSDYCSTLIRSPLETMLRVYHRNFVTEYLINNWAYGLPGSCPYNINQSCHGANNDDSSKQVREEFDSYGGTQDTGETYNLVFGKYLCGVRVVNTISNLPYEVVPSMVANILSKISAILVNIRIKQGFHIAFNNSGILNLVVELCMADRSYEDHRSTCLAQYVVFPPTVTNFQPPTHIQENGPSSKPASVSGSFSNNTDHYIKATPHEIDAIPEYFNGEIKVIKEYWLEQQYGTSTVSDNYHRSLQDMRYPEIADHLFKTDALIFECLLTHDLLHLLCDKSSPYYNLDESFTRNEILSKMSPIFSPTTSITSSNFIDASASSTRMLPSTLIEGKIRGAQPRIPLIELEYKFSLTRFLDHCQMAALNVLLFRDSSDFSSSTIDYDQIDGAKMSTNQADYQLPGKVQTEVGELNRPTASTTRREHQTSYQTDATSISNTFVNPGTGSTLDHLFLDTLHRRFKQMHDKEMKLPPCDFRTISAYLVKRRIKLEEAQVANTETGRLHLSGPDELLDQDDSVFGSRTDDEFINQDDMIEWRCLLRKGNQDSLTIVLVPATLSGVTKWLEMSHRNLTGDKLLKGYGSICPVFVFRCSNSIINDRVMSLLKDQTELRAPTAELFKLESDLSYHLGQPCQYLGRSLSTNDELENESSSEYQGSDEKMLEALHFRAFLKKIKNTVLKARFSSLSEAYLNEMFIHKSDILYYMKYINIDTQRKYHVPSLLRYLSDFIDSYEKYHSSLPKEPTGPSNPLLTSILLQKCGIFHNQPLARFNESNPLMHQLHDKRLLSFMRRNFEIDLPILSEKLANSAILREFVRHSNMNQASSYSNSIIENNSPGSSGNLATSFGHTSDLASKLPDLKGSPSFNITGSSPGSASLVERVKRFQSSRNVSSSQPNNVGSGSEIMILEAFRGPNQCLMTDIPMISNYNSSDSISLRHEQHLAEVIRRNSARKESHHYRRVLKSKASYSQSHSVIDQALKRVDDLGRLEHFCLTPLLFSPNWRSMLAPVRDHTLEFNRDRDSDENLAYSTLRFNSINNIYDPKSGEQISCAGGTDITPGSSLSSGNHLQTIQEADERWHQLVCNNYLKEYEQYIQTLGFNSIQVRYQSNTRGIPSTQQASQPNLSNQKSDRRIEDSTNHRTPSNSFSSSTAWNLSSSRPLNLNSARISKGSNSNSNTSIMMPSGSGAPVSAPTYNTGYLIKFLNSGCLVFKVGFCKPYVYSILYSIEGQRFNSSNHKTNMTAFIDELDNIKLTMHLHSFTYDYHLRSMYSYISGRQLSLFSPGYHLISFLDEFLKYYQKAPNYARNHILSDEISIDDLKVSGQQLYNYIITHNSTFNMKVAEMSQSLQSSLAARFSSRKFMTDFELSKQLNESNGTCFQADRNHANDYVLIELKREKIRYRDGKDPDVFECGLLITHDFEQSNSKDGLTLRYFFIMTNQRDLYPKLVHTYDSILSFGCHKPIRLGVPQLKTPARKVSSTSSPSVLTNQSDLDEVQSAELLTSGEMSGPASVESACNSVESSISSNLLQHISNGIISDGPTSSSSSNQIPVSSTEANVSSAKFATAATSTAIGESTETTGNGEVVSQTLQRNGAQQSSVFTGGGSFSSPRSKRKRDDSINSTSKSKQQHQGITSKIVTSNALGTAVITSQDRAICDEEITYLGYFSTEEMDMLKFLQEKTASLKSHILELVHSAEIHYQRDYLWHKLMQRNVSQKSDEISLSVEELVQLLSIVDAIDLSTLDPQLSPFTTMHTNWYLKLVKAFTDLKQNCTNSSSNQHRIYSVKASKLLLIFIDPKCVTSFILLSIDSERSSVELSLLLKNREEILKISEKNTGKGGKNNSNGGSIELDQDCQQLINDFINFCATFMWSTFLS